MTYAILGLMPRQHDAVKLHVTVMNSLFRREGTDSDTVKDENRRKVRESFDATQILKVCITLFGKILIVT